jgi:SAM-dependent methyltransferase
MYKINYLQHNWIVHHLHNRAFRGNTSLLKGRVIDLGCGTSPYKKDILEAGNEYVGVDWDNSVHDIAPDVIADLTMDLPFENDTADSLISFQVMEHLARPLFFLNECHRILKPGGVLMLSVPFQWRVHEAPHDYFRYTNFGLAYLFREAGFTEFSISELGGFWYTWLLKLNYFIATKFAPGPLKYLFAPYWFLNQLLALGLDRIFASKQEAGAYFAILKK